MNDSFKVSQWSVTNAVEKPTTGQETAVLGAHYRGLQTSGLRPTLHRECVCICLM